MSDYIPPTRDIRFVLNELLELGSYAALPAFAAVDEDLVDTVITEAGRFCGEVLAPLNRVGDEQGCTRHADGSVTTPAGFADAYARYCEAGWGTLALPEEFGGQGLPHVLATVVEEFANSSCHAFTMYPGLTHGAVAALLTKGSEELKARYLPKLVSGEWLGTMALTEAHSGTDLGLLRTRAEPREDGSFAISGEKIFCSGGEHDLTANIVHLVLARTPDAAPGSRGISLFLVPKFLPDDDDGLGERNTVSCGSIEHKMGIRGSATCVMNFDNAAGWMIGGEGEGLAAMFIMMNAARLSCGNQGVAQAELAYQKAAAYAIERRQGRALGKRADPAHPADPIIVHPDVRRMLMDARAFTEGFRALVLWTAVQIDLAHGAESEEERRAADELVGFLTPVIKGFGTDRGFETAVAMQQVFGGHGYIAEWGMEQIVRDARVPRMYEGANGVQALDLAGRKLARDGGQVAERFFALVESDCEDAPDFISSPLRDAVAEARKAAEWLVHSASGNPNDLGAGSYAFMELIGILATGWMWARMARVAAAMPDDAFYAAKLATARHFAQRSIPKCAALRREVEAGSGALMAIAAEDFLRA